MNTSASTRVRVYLGDFSHRCFAVSDRHDLNAVVFQRKTHHLLDIAVVVRNQDLGHRTPSGNTPTPDVQTALRLPFIAAARSSPFAAIACLQGGLHSIGALRFEGVNANPEMVCRK